MSSPSNTSATALRALHVPGKPVVLANVYDQATARIVAALPSCKALASASYAIARVAGLDDDDLTLETNLTAIRQIAAVARASSLPLTADLQSGYGERLEEAIKLGIEAGISGCNLEDFDSVTRQLYSREEAVTRIGRALRAAHGLGVPDFALNARCDVLVHGGELAEVIERGKAYLEAGATSVFVWGGPVRGTSRAEIAEVVKAFDGRLNAKMKLSPGYLGVKELAELGVARISVGPDLQNNMLALLAKQAESILDDGLSVTS